MIVFHGCCVAVVTCRGVPWLCCVTVGILSSDCKQQSLCVSRVHLGTSRWFPLPVHEAFCFYVSVFTCVVFVSCFIIQCLLLLHFWCLVAAFYHCIYHCLAFASCRSLMATTLLLRIFMAMGRLAACICTVVSTFMKCTCIFGLGLRSFFMLTTAYDLSHMFGTSSTTPAAHFLWIFSKTNYDWIRDISFSSALTKYLHWKTQHANHYKFWNSVRLASHCKSFSMPLILSHLGSSIFFFN